MSLKSKSKAAFFWASIQQVAIVILNLTISILLARILQPEEFGLIGMLSIFIAIGRVLMSGGMGASIIRTQLPTQRELSTIFYFNFTFSLIVYGVIFFLAPIIANFFERSILEQLIRVYSLVIVIFSFSAVQFARLTQQMDFKLALKIKLPSIILGGISGLTFANFGFGVWSLIAMYLTQALFDALQLWSRTKWRPSLVFDTDDFKKHFNFGYKISLYGILDAIYNNINNLIIGKSFSAQTLGYYTRSYTLSNMPISNFQEVISKVTYPLLSSIQDDNSSLKLYYQKITQVTMIIIFPVMTLGVIIAEPLFVFFLTEKWLPAVPYFQLLCLSGFFIPLSSNNMNILKAKGRSSLIIKIGLAEKIIVGVGLFGAVYFGVYGLLIFLVIVSSINFMIKSHLGGGLIKYGLILQVKDFLIFFLITSIVGFLTYLFFSFFFNEYSNIISIISSSLVFFILYALLLFFIKKSLLLELYSFLAKKKLQKNNG